jgi:hypothetical protein
MPQYKVKTKTFFMARLYEAGETPSFGDEVKVTRHFEPLDKPEPVAVEPEAGSTPPELMNLDELTIPQLKEAAKSMGLSPKARAGKSEIIALIQEKG